MLTFPFAFLYFLKKKMDKICRQILFEARELTKKKEKEGQKRNGQWKIE